MCYHLCLPLLNAPIITSEDFLKKHPPALKHVGYGGFSTKKATREILAWSKGPLEKVSQ